MANTKIFVITHKEFDMIKTLPTDSLGQVTNLNKIDESC